MGKITIRDVAREAGVSISLMSLVMNAKRDAEGNLDCNVNKDTARRIAEVAKRLGYRPNKAAASLRSGRFYTIGNLVAQFARARGAKRVVITDVSDYRLSKARECGIERTLNVAREPLDGKIAELFGDEGYQVAFECAGVESSVRSLMATVEKGGDVVIVGVHAKDPAVSMFHLGEHELNLIGSMMYRHEDYLKAVEEISAGRIRLAPLVSNRFPLEKYREAYEFIDANRETCMKVLIDLEDGKA